MTLEDACSVAIQQARDLVGAGIHHANLITFGPQLVYANTDPDEFVDHLYALTEYGAIYSACKTVRIGIARRKLHVALIQRKPNASAVMLRVSGGNIA